MKVSFMKDEDRGEVASFVDDAMRKAYGCQAYPLPKEGLIVRSSGTIVGAIAFSEVENGLLPIEKIYEFNSGSFPDGIRPPNATMIQFGRWVGIVPHVSEVLLFEAAQYALRKKFQWAVSEVKPHVMRHFRRLGVPLIALRGELQRGRIPIAVLPYYVQPLPIPCIVSIHLLLKVFIQKIKILPIRYARL
jgi:hypothetical protein